MHVTQVTKKGKKSIKIADGKWVVETSTFIDRGPGGYAETIATFLVLGTTNYEVITNEVTDQEDLLTIVSDIPFGIIEEIITDGVVTSRWFVCARKVQGRRAQFPPKTPRPRAVLPPEERGKERGQKLSRLSDVAEIIQMDPAELLLRFRPFMDREEPVIKVYHSREDGEPNGEWIILSATTVEEMVDLAGDRGSRYWIRNKFALAVIQMVICFGYVPRLPNVD